MRTVALAGSVLALGLLAGSASTRAAIVLDQSFLTGPPDGVQARIGVLPQIGAYRPYQSFTVGVAGTLDSVEVYIDKDGDPTEDVILEIVPGADPAGMALASAVIASAQVPLVVGPLLVDLSAAGLAVAVGDSLAFRLSSLQDFSGNLNEYRAMGNGLGGYAAGTGGHLYPAQGSGPRDWDFYFRTFVDAGVPPIPEPGQIALLGLGFAGIAGARLRRRR